MAELTLLEHLVQIPIVLTGLVSVGALVGNIGSHYMTYFDLRQKAKKNSEEAYIEAQKTLDEMNSKGWIYRNVGFFGPRIAYERFLKKNGEGF